MTWTTERPTKEGAYWFKADGFEEQVVMIYEGLNGLWVAYPGSDVDDFLDSIVAQWAGPIPLPDDPTEG